LIAFHDYAEYFPGVRAFVDELLRSGDFEEVARQGTLVALRRLPLRRLPERTAPTAARAISPPTAAERRGREIGPLVSCLMPTFNRRDWVRTAIECFLAQDYPQRELLIIDDGRDRVEDLLPVDGRVQYLPLGARHSIGTKRNIAARAARGEILAHWDDDDWYADGWLRAAVTTLVAGQMDIVGLDTVLFHDPLHRKAWRYQYPSDAPPWAHDPTLCYWRAVWEAHPLPDTNYGLDTAYLSGTLGQRLGRVTDYRLFVGTVHNGNTSFKRTTDSWWQPHPADDIVALKRHNIIRAVSR
jgi:glycosyltransferase involved in cell wall biosynthesis